MENNISKLSLSDLIVEVLFCPKFAFFIAAQLNTQHFKVKGKETADTFLD